MDTPVPAGRVTRTHEDAPFRRCMGPMLAFLVPFAARLIIPIAALDSATSPRSTPLMTADELAALLRVPRRTIFSWVDAGLMPSIHCGPRLLRFSQEDLDEFFRRSAEAAP